MAKVNIRDINHLSISIASPEDIHSWSYGEVTKPETINYRTQRPEKDGLFSERIFGPTKDYECYCGKYKKVRYKGVVCEKCGVEVTRSDVRRERMGHIDLAAPAVHIWFLKTIPSVISLLLNVSVAKLERVVYYAAYIVTDVDGENRKNAMQMIKEEFKNMKAQEGVDIKELESSKKKSEEILKTLKKGMVLSEEDYYLLSQKYGNVFEAGRGAEAIRKIMKNLDVKKITSRIERELEETKDAGRRKKLLRRYKVAKNFAESGSKPEWMILNTLPVIPPELRPMVPLDGGRFATADLNDLYRRVINRNNRLKKLIELKSPDVILTNEKRMLQESVDALIDNTKRSTGQVLSTKRRPLKSLADNLKGKQGRFRRNLLGKRVDYSGRSVIVVGPELQLDQCGLPKKLALEIFRPFVINKIIERGIAYNIKQANRFIEQEGSEVWGILEEVITNKRVLLNRAPTLHRLGIQSFKPVLIEDLAIRVHPLVCTAFNADFDGDQMAVHLPLTEEGQYESRTLMNAAENLLKPANGDPVVSPTHDMVLGCYYLTGTDEGSKGEGKSFSSPSEVEIAYEHNLVELRTKINVRIEDKIIKTTYGRILFNKILPPEIEFVNKQLTKKALSKVVARIIEKYGIESSYIYLDKIKNLGFDYATLSAISMGMHDAQIPDEKSGFIEEAEKEIDKIDNMYDEGLLTDEERQERIINIWTKTTDDISNIAPGTLDKTNPIFSIINSKARGSWAQLRQIIGMRGLVANPKNETIVELPVKSSYTEGLKALEYFISTHGARKGLTDTALKTASAGYLTRRLIDVSQDIIVRKDNCKTKKGLEIKKSDGDEYGYSFKERIYSRTVLNDIKSGNKILVRKNETITREAAEAIDKAGIESITVRSPITCESTKGVCSKCYGLDLAKGEYIKKGEAIGIVAAQSIGEPGTQLTLRTFHVGGIAGVDITHGLPRVEEVFEARTPKGKSIMSKVDGKVDYIEEKNLVKIIGIAKNTKSKKSSKKNIVEYVVPKGVRTLVKEGDRVTKGQILSEGRIDLRELLNYVGVDDLQRYIINEVQKVYVPEGAVINDKHIEIIVRQMLSKVSIKDPGDTGFMEGELIDKYKLKEINEEVARKGGKKAKYIQRVMGITKIALGTESFLSAASFQETSKVLVNAAMENKVDNLNGLKENVIIGKLIPAGTGIRGIPKEEITNDESYEENYGENKNEEEKTGENVDNSK